MCALRGTLVVVRRAVVGAEVPDLNRSVIAIDERLPARRSPSFRSARPPDPVGSPSLPLPPQQLSVLGAAFFPGPDPTERKIKP